MSNEIVGQPLWTIYLQDFRWRYNGTHSLSNFSLPVFNAPLLPISILQLLIDQRLDMRFGSLVSLPTLRAVLGCLSSLAEYSEHSQLGSSLPCRYVPPLSSLCHLLANHWAWLLRMFPLRTDEANVNFRCVAMLGIFNGIASGTFLALVSVFPIKTPVG